MHLALDDLRVTWCNEIRMEIKTSNNCLHHLAFIKLAVAACGRLAFICVFHLSAHIQVHVYLKQVDDLASQCAVRFNMA